MIAEDDGIKKRDGNQQVRRLAKLDELFAVIRLCMSVMVLGRYDESLGGGLRLIRNRPTVLFVIVNSFLVLSTTTASTFVFTEFEITHVCWQCCVFTIGFLCDLKILRTIVYLSDIEIVMLKLSTLEKDEDDDVAFNGSVKLIKVYVIGSFLCAFLIASIFLITMLSQLIKGEPVELLLVWPAFIFVDLTKHPAYEIMMVSQCACAVIRTCAYIEYEMSFICLTGRLAGKVYGLARNVRAILPNDYHQLRMNIRNHKKIISLFEDINKMYSTILPFDFLIATMVLCFSFLMVMIFESWGSVLFKSIFVVWTSHVFVICWYAEKTCEASDDLFRATYEAPWYESDRKFCTTLIIFMMRAQKPMQMNLGQFGVVKMNTATSISRLAYSFYACLRMFFNEDQ